MIARRQPFSTYSLALLTVYLAGCVSGQNGLSAALPNNNSHPPAVELSATPFFSQEDYQCGPAALATALGVSGVNVTPAELTPKVYLPGRKGSLQLELGAATRRHGRIPYPIQPSLTALVRELQAGHPVLVLQNLGVSWLPRWHYAVVIGYDKDRNLIILRSGTTPRKEMDTKLFLRTWRRAQHWGLVVLKPGKLPADPQPEPYLEAVSALEASGAYRESVPAYQAALGRWPGNFWARMGIANSYLGLGHHNEAELHLRNLLIDYPRHPAVLNNLAEVLAHRGCLDAARSLINQALTAQQVSRPMAELLQRTLVQINKLDDPPTRPQDTHCEP